MFDLKLRVCFKTWIYIVYCMRTDLAAVTYVQMNIVKLFCYFDQYDTTSIAILRLQKETHFEWKYFATFMLPAISKTF